MPIATTRSLSPNDDVREAKRPKMEVVKQSNEEKMMNSNAAYSSALNISHSAERLDERSEAELVEEQMSLPIEFPKTYEKELNYRDKLVLAPMVRTGSLPMRLLSLYYGAGLVWSPEVVDKAIIGCERSVDLIFQIGSSNPELAVKAAQTVQQDVSGIDLNCGCPKPFSTHSGMGAALLSTPDILLNILRALLKSIPLPISSKIRLLPTQPSTLFLVSRIIRTGIRNLTVHCRTRDMRPGERALWERLADIVALGQKRGLPVICNGDGDGWANWEKIRAETNADSVMLARAAERNPSVFLPTGPVCNLTEVVPKLLAIAQHTNNPWGNTKFLLTQFKASPHPISDMSKQERKQASEVVSKSKTIDQVAEGLQIPLKDIEDTFQQIVQRIEERGQVETDIFQERHEAEAKGQVADEPVVLEKEAEMDGFDVGVGEAQQLKD